MSMVINTNMGSENAVRILDRTSREMSTSMERLTSGQRINHSKDDAAGMAIVTGMTSQIMGTSQAVRNANDGISLVQTMDGAMDEVVSMMQRMRELGIQAMNGTYNAENRSQMDAEFSQLHNEMGRIRQTTKFNENNLFSGTNNFSVHVGWETGANNKIQISAFDLQSANVMVSNGHSLGTAGAAALAVSALDQGLSKINTKRAQWGALQNRLEHTVNNLQNVNENMIASRSRIQDADFATESANLARTQVLQQAGMSMLSQANQSSQNVMSLLR